MQFKPLPTDSDIGTTLAQRLQFLRHYRNLTIKDLAKRVRFTIKRLEDLESGLETWLSFTDRQMLAKALAIEPNILREVEFRPDIPMPIESHMLDRNTSDELSDRILAGDDQLQCPDCHQILKATIEEGFDLDGRRIRIPKAYCPKCPFVLR